MLERYSLGASAGELAEFFSIDPHGFDKPRYNAAPAQLLPVITVGSPGLSHFYWGTAPQWARNKPVAERVINLRLELLTERPSSRKKVGKNRCLVPADGFYGWKKVGKKVAIPYRLQLVTKSLFAMAGLWEEYDDESGQQVHTFSIITVPSVGVVAEISDRMPVILDREGEKTWLTPEVGEQELVAHLSATRAEITAYTISPRINSITADDLTLIQPTPPADQFGNLRLFE